MIDCDTCAKIYHINCLDPPLDCVPKKTKLYGWECVSCVQKKQNSDEESIRNETSMDNKRLRRERKPRVLNKVSEKSYPKTKIRKKNTRTRKNDGKNIKNEIQSQDNSVIAVSDGNLNVSVKKSIDSDSEAIYILDDESQSPKGKFKSNYAFSKNIRAFKTLPVDSGNEAESEIAKRSRILFKNSVNQNEEIENSHGEKLADSSNARKDSAVKSPNLKILEK